MDIHTFITENGIRSTIESIHRRTDGVRSFDSNCSHYRVTFDHDGKRMTVQFSQGSGHNGKTPSAGDVLDCIASDVSGFEGRSYEEWASDYGYPIPSDDDPYNRKTYNMIGRQAAALRKMLGDDLMAKLMECERL